MSAVEHYISDAVVFGLPQAESRFVTGQTIAPAIEALVRQHSRLVFRIAYSVVRNHADAEDVVQEVFLRVSKHGAKGIDDPKAWISRIAWRASVDRYRSRDAASKKNLTNGFMLRSCPTLAPNSTLYHARPSRCLIA